MTHEAKTPEGGEAPGANSELYRLWLTRDVRRYHIYWGPKPEGYYRLLEPPNKMAWSDFRSNRAWRDHFPGQIFDLCAADFEAQFPNLVMQPGPEAKEISLTGEFVKRIKCLFCDRELESGEEFLSMDTRCICARCVCAMNEAATLHGVHRA